MRDTEKGVQGNYSGLAAVLQRQGHQQPGLGAPFLDKGVCCALIRRSLEKIATIDFQRSTGTGETKITIACDG